MGIKGLATFLSFVTLFSFQTVYADLWDQGYVDSEPEFLNCGRACIGSPEIQAYLYTDYQIQQRGIYIEQDGADLMRSQIPWSTSRNKRLRKFGRSLYKHNNAYSVAAFRIGILIQEEDKSAHSAIWREIRKPLLYSLRNQITSALKKRRGNLSAWAVEQGLDIGASMAGLDSIGRGQDVIDSDEITDVSSYKTSFSVRLDPWKGRYGFRTKAQIFRGLRDPHVLQFSYYYCESSWGLGDRVCAYLHQYQVGWGYRYRRTGRDVSFHISIYYEGKSLNSDAYIIDGTPYEFKPWGFQTRLRMAI